MSDNILSQEELDALLNGLMLGDAMTPALSDSDKDLLGEIGNIAMGSASTALSTILQKTVNITTPRVSITTLNEMKKDFEMPLVALEVEYTEGLSGVNLLLMKITDAAIISNVMMGGSGVGAEVENKTELTEIELSAVEEAMNQMVGSAATALSQLLSIPTNISPPVAKVWDNTIPNLSHKVDENEEIVKIAFRMTIENFVDSEIMLILTVGTSKLIIDKMYSGQNDEPVKTEPSKIETKKEIKSTSVEEVPEIYNQSNKNTQNQMPVNVQMAQFAPLKSVNTGDIQNIDLILDVPLEVSVVLGRTKKTIKDILQLGSGSLVELEALTEDPVEILVNGKKVAVGEVVVIDESFGVRVTDILSSAERVKSLQAK